MFEHELNEYKSVQVTRILHDFYRAIPSAASMAAAASMHASDRSPRCGQRERRSEGPAWGSAYKARLAEFPRSMVAAGHGTSLPVETNSVTLDPQLKDAWGMPAIRVTYKDHPDDLANARFLQDRAAEILDAAGARRVSKAPVTASSLLDAPARHVPHGQ